MRFFRYQAREGKARDGFYKELFTLMIPIAIQNLITQAVNMADVLMVGQLDQTSLSASSLAGQVQFVLFFIFFGLTSVITILAAQYWGKDDRKVIAKILGLGLYVGLSVSSIVAALAFFVPQTVMRFWTNDPELVETGAKYLRLVALSYLFMGFTQPYLAITRSCERVKFSMVLSIITLGANVILNAVLIFGLLGFPALGIEGAAIATTISRGLELLICLVDFLNQKTFPKRLSNMFRLPKTLLQDAVRYTLPAFLNDVLWGFAYNMNSVIMGHLGTDIVAANSIVIVVRDLITSRDHAGQGARRKAAGPGGGRRQVAGPRHGDMRTDRRCANPGCDTVRSAFCQGVGDRGFVHDRDDAFKRTVPDGTAREYSGHRRDPALRRRLALWHVR